MHRFVLGRPTRAGAMRFTIAVLAGAAAGLVATSAARAQSECDQLAKMLKTNSDLVQSFSAKSKAKKITAPEACVQLGQIQSGSATLIKALEANGAWCHAPDNILPQVKQLTENVSKSRAQACKVAEQMKKMQAQQAQQQRGPDGKPMGPLGGTGDILGGPIKVPQGAL
jgi:hypothetical protein